MNYSSDHNLGLDLARATEAAALAAGRWMGVGETDASDKAATLAMQEALNQIDFDGRILFSEIDKLGADDPLHPGQPLGSGRGPQMDLVVDPIEGRALLSRGHPDAIAVAAAAPRGAFWSVPHAVYMEKLVVGPEVAPVLVPECLDAPAAWTLALVARAQDKAISDLVVFMLNRPRHQDLIREIRDAGARVMLRSEGDLIGSLKALLPGGGVDLMMGIGNYPEGLMAACAARAGNGAMLGRLAPQTEAEREAVLSSGGDLRRIYTVQELVQGSQTFFTATGITDGALLKGVQYHGARATSNSLIMRGETHTRRMIEAEHLLIAEGIAS
ncbi:MAG: fructose-bisphosphatase class II family protein [Anaerolineae bacterium]|nr:fructose-bisphosphatase class II family protein [Anaerolineae bacterium]